MFQRFNCIFGYNPPVRHHVWEDGIVLRAKYKGCEVEMVRDFQGWKPDPQKQRTTEKDDA